MLYFPCDHYRRNRCTNDVSPKVAEASPPHLGDVLADVLVTRGERYVRLPRCEPWRGREPRAEKGVGLQLTESGRLSGASVATLSTRRAAVASDRAGYRDPTVSLVRSRIRAQVLFRIHSDTFQKAREWPTRTNIAVPCAFNHCVVWCVFVRKNDKSGLLPGGEITPNKSPAALSDGR